ncbi:hypothetical protein SERLADRAFT_467312 [Serpula lacrymans var. lacrymans S7.9]|uniref:Uncharacterized protein n=1 Tax=Serpula lacrymans var. lacrymans (strain S7.9) TaxID=578457 RepID=F8NW18_SERL9|nr:uncharacterized protein SERLADRAFT_467312 [Serpula lacrymans var. lacrymans S7.9]EGO24275.1 hypothetical protein SERLADRAFT_467312 [Serpula lacrymans var. lacrymans S7.9]
MYAILAARNATKAVYRVSTVIKPSSRLTSTRHYSSTMHDNDAELLDREKSRNLNKNQHKTSTPIEDAPGWNEGLASASEAHVKADRSEIPMHDLQRRTVNYIQSRHAPDERLDQREAFYARDEITGPLRTASVGEFEVDMEGTEVDPDGRSVRRVVREEKTELNVKRES